MNRREAEAFIAALVRMREGATDEQALAAPELYPTWREDADYTVGDRVLYDGTLYKVLISHTSQAAWLPADSPSIFAKVLIPGSEVPEWEQPDSTNAYMAGDKVTYEGRTWVSTVDGNVWKPGEYGWEIVE